MAPGYATHAQTGVAPQVQIIPESLDIALDAGASSSRTLTLSNLSEEDTLFFAFRGLAGSKASKKVGPQGRGYKWMDSREPNGPVFEWADITTIGTPLVLNNDDAVTVPLPFPFSFYGIPQHEVTISSNGYLTFGSSGREAFNQTVPAISHPNALIAPFWDDLDPTLGGSIHHFFDRAQQRFIVQYTNVPLQNTRLSLVRNTFQILLSANGDIQFQYLDVGTGKNSTVGLENDLGTEGLQLSNNKAFLENGVCISFRPLPTFITITPASGFIAPGEHRQLMLDVDASEVDAEAYALDFLLETNDVTEPIVVIPVSIDILNEAFPFIITPGRLEAELERGGTTTQTLTIENTDQARSQSFRIKIRGAALESGKDESISEQPNPGTLFHKTSQGLQESTRAHTTLLNPALAGPGTFSTLLLDAPDVLAPTVLSPPSYAGEFAYGEPNLVYYITVPDNQLQTIDVVTGRRTVLGSLGTASLGERWTGMAVDPTEGLLYGTTTNSEGSYLYQIDLAKTIAVLIGEIQSGPRVGAIAVDASGQLYGIDITRDELLVIDKRTGISHSRGLLGYNADFVDLQGLDIDLATGTMYLAGYNGTTRTSELRTVNTTSGATTLLTTYEMGTLFGYLALPSGTFITPSVFAGTVPPAGSLTLGVNFDAANLLGGTYEAALRVEAADRAGTPDTLITAHLNVLGAPRISITDQRTFITFGPRFIGTSLEIPFELSNIGFSDLVIEDITSDLSVFDLSALSREALPVRLAPGERHTFRAQFSPATAGPFAGTLLIENSDPLTPALKIFTSGLGINPPTITPDTLAIIVAAGKTQEEQFSVRNNGAGQIQFTLIDHPEGFSDAVTPPLLSEGFEQGIPASWTVIDHAGRGVVWQAHDDFAEQDYLNYTGGRGRSAMVSSHAMPGVPVNAELRTPLLQATAENLVLRFKVSFIEDGLSNDYLDLDISLDAGATWTQVERWDKDLGNTFATPGESLIYKLGSYLDTGDTFMLRWRYFDTGFRPEAFYAQIDDVHIIAEPTILSFPEPTGTVSPQSISEVVVEIDGDGLVPGTYEAGITVDIRSPAQLDHFIPIVLTVTDGISVELTEVEGHPNQVFEVPITVQGPDPVASFMFALDFDPTLLEIVEVITDSTLTERASLEFAPPSPGRLEVAARSMLGASEGTLLKLRLRAKEELGETSLTFSSFTVNDGLLPVSFTEGLVKVVPLVGDVNLDLAISYADAGLLGRYVSRWTVLSATAKEAADVSGDGGVTSRDVALLRRFISGDIPCLPAAAGCSVPQIFYSQAEAAKTASEVAELPAAFELAPNFPNPVQFSTTITYGLPERTTARLVIYNTLGQPVRHFARKEQDAGWYSVHWDGRNDAGQPVASGVYLYKFQAGSFVTTRRLLVVR